MNLIFKIRSQLPGFAVTGSFCVSVIYDIAYVNVVAKLGTNLEYCTNSRNQPDHYGKLALIFRR